MANVLNIFVSALILNWMLAHDSIDPAQHAAWKTNLESIIDRLSTRYPSLLHFTGFPVDWKKNPLWWQV